MQSFSKWQLFWLKALVTAVLGAGFFISYGWVNHHTSQLSHVPSFAFAWEQSLPFVPWLIIPYMSSDLIFVIAFMLCRDTTELRTLGARALFVNVVSILVFWLMPLKCALVRPEVTDPLLKPWFQLLALDEPFNQFPSMHIGYGLIFWTIIRERSVSWSRWAVDVWFLMIAASTLLVWQHHAIDLIGGLIVALLSMALFPYGPSHAITNPSGSVIPEFLASSSRLEAAFVTIAGIALTAGVGGSGLGAAAGYYVALGFLGIACAYRTKNFTIFSKRNGRIPFFRMVLFGPYLLLARLSWVCHLRRSGDTIVTIVPGLCLGSRPFPSDFAKITLPPETIVIDLSAELSAAAPYLAMTYRHFPILDLATPRISQLHQIVVAIENLERESPESTVLIHCALGLSRSVLVATALLVSRGYTVEAAINVMRRVRPRMILPQTYVQLLDGFAATRPSSVIGSFEAASVARAVGMR